MAVNGASHNPMQHQTGPEFANSDVPPVADGVKQDILKNADQGQEKNPKQLAREKAAAEKKAKYESKLKAQAEKETQERHKKPKKAVKDQLAPASVPKYVEKTLPGEKKILQDIDSPALKAYDPAAVESAWYSWWEKENFFAPEFTADGKIKPAGSFVVPIPPPNVTGQLHVGHALTIAIQDTLVRWNRMLGKTVLYLPGFDHAGISTQSVVEKKLWQVEGKTRHDYIREEFLEKVWQWKEEFSGKINAQLRRLGGSFDWTRVAFTMNDDLTRAVNENFVRLFEDGVIYRANRLVNWCCQLSTTLSNLEVDQLELKGRTLLHVPGYPENERVEFGVLTSFAYEIIGSHERIVVATTRPETMLGDTAVAVHPDDMRYKHLHGKLIQHPFIDRKLPIIADTEVDMSFGTGAVKITPAHDMADYLKGKRHSLPFINLLNDDGTYNENAGEWNGMKRFHVRKAIVQRLKDDGLFVEVVDNPMSIPQCAKSKDIIEPAMKPQWWVRQAELAQAASAAVREGQILIRPRVSEQDFHRWMTDIQDWCISRQLWWGHRCPVYRVLFEGKEDEGEEVWIAGRTLKEAEQKAAEKFKGQKYRMQQDEDVLDTWFSSALWPFSTLGWPDQTDDMKNFYPTSLLETGWDILFFWVARMVMLGLKLTDNVPFTEVFCHALIRDAHGRKMSKTLGNVIDPIDVIEGTSLESLQNKLLGGNLDPREVEKAKSAQKQDFPNGIPQCGSDALRFALCAYTTGGRDINLDVLRIEAYRKFCNKMYQATKFAMMRLGLDFNPRASAKVDGSESLVEQWILHRFNRAAKLMNETLAQRNFLEATSVVYHFWLNDLCDVYIENSKLLLLEGSQSEKVSAQQTLYTCLEGALKMISPFMPFISEELWQRLPRRPGDETPTIIKASYPVFDPSFDNEAAESSYTFLLDVVGTVRSMMSQFNIVKNSSVYFHTSDGALAKLFVEQKANVVALIKGCDDINITEQAPEGCASASINASCRVSLMVKGHADISRELERTKKSLDKSQGQINLLNKATTNDRYLEEATPERKRIDQGRKADLEGDVDTLRGVIEALQRMSN